MKNTYEIGKFNGYTVLCCNGEYVLDTEGDPASTEENSFEDVFNGLTEEEVRTESNFHFASSEELAEISSFGIHNWIDAKEA